MKPITIGIMPLPDTPFTRGKCGYKLIQYMAAGRPVVASPVGVNQTIVQHGVNGYLAETGAEWEGALSALLSDGALRARMGMEGRRLVERRYSIEATVSTLAEVLDPARPRWTLPAVARR